MPVVDLHVTIFYPYFKNFIYSTLWKHLHFFFRNIHVHVCGSLTKFIIELLDFCQFHGWKIVSKCGFNLHFPFIDIEHLCIYLKAVCIFFL